MTTVAQTLQKSQSLSTVRCSYDRQIQTEVRPFLNFKLLRFDYSNTGLKYSVCFMSVPVKQDTDVVYSEVRNSRQGMINILLFAQTVFLLHDERNQVIRKEKKEKSNHQETGSTPTKHLHCY